MAEGQTLNVLALKPKFFNLAETPDKSKETVL